MKNFIVFDKNNGKILRVGSCPDGDFKLQVQTPNEEMLEGIANDITQKIVGGKLVDKTSGEIEAENPLEVPVGQQKVELTNDQWQDIINRLEFLENR